MAHRLNSAAWDRLLEKAQVEVSRILRALPSHLRNTAQSVTLAYEGSPSNALIKDGIEPDTLGLFVGDAFADAEQSASPIPPQIILYLENLWDLAEHDDEIFLDEVRATYLHELGHYLGLEEDELTDRGLE